MRRLGQILGTRVLLQQQAQRAGGFQEAIGPADHHGGAIQAEDPVFPRQAPDLLLGGRHDLASAGPGDPGLLGRQLQRTTLLGWVSSAGGMAPDHARKAVRPPGRSRHG
ncbi:hypothetical protein [Roseomonas gilardii]|uniref:hypothetical protein n=1 Tax=Roseomonas gilardii TaxID=257708 RepID=UPI0016437E6D|nr:hypothetical protein [Roseomonas gilardii]